MMTRDLDLITAVAMEVRADLEARYELPLYGYCMEATDLIVAALQAKGFQATSCEGWCAYEDEDYGTSRPWEAHTWCEVLLPGSSEPLIVDVTVDQFEGGFYEELPKILVGPLPSYFTYDEPVL